MKKIKTEVVYAKKLPSLKLLHPPKSAKDFLFIVDQLVFRNNPQVARWLAGMPYVYPVKAGEQLKQIRTLPSHLERIFSLLDGASHRGLTVVAIGGGSVGDFAGFIASIFKRGVDLIQIPSSWLAAIDSAHGGKNGLNLKEFKNQIGTFHHPHRVLIVEEVLASQPVQQCEDALGELYKMALLTPQSWGQEVLGLGKITPKLMRQYLPLAVAEKYRIVNKDPLEKKGIRSFLNLGHTFGHVIELEQKRPHGTAVAIGLKFALQWSFERGELSLGTWRRISNSPMFHYLEGLKFGALSEDRFRSILSQDKKQQSPGQIQFVFLKKLGQPVLIRLAIEELITAGKKHGFIESPRP